MICRQKSNAFDLLVLKLSAVRKCLEIMSKEKSKKHFKKKRKTKRNKSMNCINAVSKAVPCLSKRQPSANWLNFVKSNGVKGKAFKIHAVQMSEAKVEKQPKPPVETKVVALDCEMVCAVNDQNILARVSLVNFKLECIYDKYVKPIDKVTDYRTRFSGIREEDLQNGIEFEVVQEEVRNLLYNKILVGHALHNDMRALKFGHHKQLIRDTATYPPFQKGCETMSPSLKKVAKIFLNETIQEGEHSSVEDARTAMKLYIKFRKEWEMSLVQHEKESVQVGT